MDIKATNSNQAVADRLHTMRLEYVENLSDKIRQMQNAWDSWCKTPANFEPADLLYRLAHNLAGSGSTFGFPRISTASRALMLTLSECRAECTALDSKYQEKINTLLSDLCEVVELCSIEISVKQSQHKNITKLSVKKERNPKLVFVVDDDVEFSERMGAKLQEYGYEVTLFSNIHDFELILEVTHPALIIMDMMLPEGSLAGADSIGNVMRKGLEDIPVVFLSVRDDLESRLSAVRAGAMRYLTKPVNMQLLRETLNHLTHFQGVDSYRVLMVDDDSYLTSLYQSLLGDAGIQVHVLNDPVNTLQEIKAVNPDLILLDVNMPGINGLEIGAVIRQFDEYLHIPIVFLTADRDMGKRLASMHLGGDDFLNKPVDPGFLIEVLRTRIEKSRALKSGEQHIKQLMRELQNHKYAQDSHSIISVADTAGIITEVNRKFCEISGYSKEELIGKNHRIVKSDYHFSEFYEELWATIITGEVWQGQIKNRKKDGSYYWVNATITPILDEFGVPEEYISVRTDITEMKELELRLIEEQERLNLAMDATNTGFWEWNLSESKTFYSDRCRSLLKMDDQVEISWPMLIHPDDFAAVSDQLIKHLSGESELYASEHRKQNSEGNWEWVYECGKVVVRDAGGQVMRMMGTMQLINERKELEALHEQMSQQLLQASKMEAIGHLTSGVAHDFNNILGGMLGYLELSLALLKRESPNLEKLNKYMLETQLAGRRAKELVAQMLVFSRLAPSQQDEGPPATWLQPVIKEVINLLHSSIPATLKLNYHLPTNDLQAAIQPVHLHQILLNLGINARDAMDAYGQLDFSLSEIRLKENACASCGEILSGIFVDISVKDNGSGITEEVKQKMFEPFFTTKVAGKGTGMGLSVVNNIVHTLGGHIHVDSEIGKGTTVHILLPKIETVSVGVEGGEAEVQLSAQELDGVRILVVDDEHTMAAMLTEFLGMHGASVSTYTQAQEALRNFLLMPNAFDIVITDETMPELTGLNMARQMLAQRPDLPIILCTGYSESATPESTVEAGVAAFMRKPLDVSQLIVNIGRLVNK